MSAGFTPGPWEIYPQPIKGAGDAILELVEQVQGTEPIGDTLYLINADGKCPAVTGCGPTSEANARLIAAAPELYEALELYQRAIGPLTGRPLTDEQWKMLHDVFAIAATALNKARGF